MNHSKTKILGEQLKMCFASIRGPRRRWQAICAGILGCALALAVATRYTDFGHPNTGHSTSIAQQDEGTKRQHIEKSSFNWTFSFTHFARVNPVRRSLRAAFFDPPSVLSLRGKDLYNRPPPAF